MAWHRPRRQSIGVAALGDRARGAARGQQATDKEQGAERRPPCERGPHLGDARARSAADHTSCTLSNGAWDAPGPERELSDPLR